MLPSPFTYWGVFFLSFFFVCFFLSLVGTRVGFSEFPQGEETAFQFLSGPGWIHFSNSPVWVCRNTARKSYYTIMAD